MKMIPGALAALIRYEQIISPNWEVFGDPQVVLVLEGPMGLSETMVRVMITSLEQLNEIGAKITEYARQFNGDSYEPVA